MIVVNNEIILKNCPNVFRFYYQNIKKKNLKKLKHLNQNFNTII